MCFTVQLSMREHLEKTSRKAKSELSEERSSADKGSRTTDNKTSGGDAPGGDTRTHPEHDG
jgi:hypothetical protein